MKQPRKLVWRAGICEDVLLVANYSNYQFEIRYSIDLKMKITTIFALYVFKYGRLVLKETVYVDPKQLMNFAESWMNEQYDMIEGRKA